MNLLRLREIEEEAFTCPHYRYFNLKSESEVERTKLAKLSFKKLTPDDQLLFTKSWKKFCEENKISYSIDEGLRYRELAQTNLFFLCKLLEKYKDITLRTHEEICNDFFVTKDPTVSTFEKFAKEYVYLKDRLLLVPRGGFKSSIDIADCVQWTICYPEVTILILTGVHGLAKDFVGELRGHFTLDEIGKDKNDKPIYGPRLMQDGTHSIFQVLFPEHCTKDEGKVTEFQTPACKTPDKEPTIMAAGIEMSLSGWHFCLIKADDVVTNENSQTNTRLESVNRQVSINRAMMHPYGFFDKIGTWYDMSDLYGLDIQYEELLKSDGESPSMIIYLRSAWKPTEEAKKLGKIEEEMLESDWDIWFPERLPYKFLKAEKKKDPTGFAIKYENDPRKAHEVKFPRELLLRRTITANMLPQQGMIVTTCDTAYSTKSWADYTVLITALIYGGRFYIIDMVRGRFNDIELPAVIASTGYKWKPKRIAIEDSVGVRWMNREIRREMDKLGISIPIEYISLGAGNKTRSKEIKAKPVLRLLGDERLYFSNSCSGLEELYSELEKFNTPSSTHDDVVDGLSILVDVFCAYADMDQRINFVQSDFAADRMSTERHNLIYGLGKYSRHNISSMTPIVDDNPVTAFEQQNQQIVERDIDPLAEVFS